MDSIRQNKVARLIQKDLTELFRQECKEYAQGAMLSITTVRVSPDLSVAYIYISIFPSEKAPKVMDILKENSRALRGELGNRMGRQLRIIPEISFYVDGSLDYVAHIEELLKK